LELKLQPFTARVKLADPGATIGWLMEVMHGEGNAPTKNGQPLLAVPPTVTTSGPVVTPDGAVVEILVLLQLDTVAVTPLKVTVLLPCVDPKPDP